MLYGVMINAVAVLGGGLLGVLLKKGLSENVKNTLMQGLALGVVYVGVNGIFSGHNTIFIILSLTIGAMVGEIIDFDGRLLSFVGKVEKKLIGKKKMQISEGFINATLFICPGAMAILGSLQSGLEGSNEILYAKAFIDLIFVIILAASSGIGVCLSAISVFLYEVMLTLGASYLSLFLSDIVIDEMACVGSILILALGCNMLKVTDLKMANMIFSPFIPIFLYAIF